MKLDNIIDICVAIDIAILGIAYPIIVDKISDIGEKYNSDYLSNVFNSEFPQRPVKYKWKKKSREISLFKLFLYITILSFLPLIFNAEPWFECDYGIINQSAQYIVLILSAILAISFFMWLDVVVKYNGKATTLVQHLISRYNDGKNSEEDYNLKAINEFALHAIKNQDEHLQNTLLEFYHMAFSQVRRAHDPTKPLIYPVDLYEMVYRLCYELVNTENKHLLALEHRAVSGLWYLGEDSEQIEISDATYSWLWRNLNTIAEKDKFIRMYWATAHQYYDFRLRYKLPEYDNAFQVINKNIVDKREKERQRFLEFNLALGGLLLYRKQYQTLNYIFHYTQSQPPSYVLLPEHMSAIYHWFESFSNEFKNRREPIDHKFYFTGLDNLGIRREVGYWISSYMALLFIRLYTLHQYYTYQEFTEQPNLPETIRELREWLQALSFFERCLRQLIENKDLLSELGFEKVVAANEERFFEYIQELKQRIEAAIEDRHVQAELSPEKLQQFNTSSAAIISDAFAEYSHIANTGDYTDNEEDDTDLKLTVRGQTILSSKSSFLDETGVAHLNYDSFLAGAIASQSIRRYIPNSFMVAKTRRYLLNRDNIAEGLKMMIGTSKDIVIVSVNLHFETKVKLKGYEGFLKEIKGTEHHVQDTLYVLAKSDLPHFIHKELDSEIVAREHYTLINDDLKIYAAILDLSQELYSPAKEKWSSEDLEGDTKVQVTIGFLTLLIYKKDREIIQVNIASRYREQGIQNSLEDIEPLQQ